MLANILLWGGYFLLFSYLVAKGRRNDVALSGAVGFGVQAFA